MSRETWPEPAAERFDLIFAALSDPTRRAILVRLAAGEASVAELQAPFGMSQPAISKHLAVLERAGLVSRGRDAQKRPRRLAAEPLAEAMAWLEAFRPLWSQGLASLPSAEAAPAEPKAPRARGGSLGRKKARP